MTDYHDMWKELGIDLDAHDGLLEVLPPMYEENILSQEGRPGGMEYFDFVFSEVHGLRIKELVEHREAGAVVVGTFCTYVPEELIIAAGGICVGLCAGAQVAAEEAEKYLPRNICALIKSSLGFKLAKVCPYIESCDLLVGETTCDGKKKYFEMLGELQPVHIMEVPQMKLEHDRDLWRKEIRRMLERMEEMTGKKIGEKQIRDAIRLVNEKRKALLRLEELRKSDPPVISGRDALLIDQIAFYDDPARLTEKINALCDELEERKKAGVSIGGAHRPRILLSGCPMALPNWKVATLIETSGAVVAMDEMCTGIRYFDNLVEEDAADTEALLDNIADRYLNIHCAIFTPNRERIEHIKQLVEDYDIDAVVHYSLQFCDPYTVEAFSVQREMEKEGVPFLYLETDYSSEDTGQLTTRIQALIEMVGCAEKA
ncbi:MAG: double-cubane-cluster-containing anaerobic reductase [Actinomycetota bacterium]|nr:double-cubane-cluster-containing anaerobic reductase [Actinomycetota bacterium]MDD5666848.1 double-cubane-cluster-containing anaerobic reductase [Actinomycetota bacterium]